MWLSPFEISLKSDSLISVKCHDVIRHTLLHAPHAKNIQNTKSRNPGEKKTGSQCYLLVCHKNLRTHPPSLSSITLLSSICYTATSVLLTKLNSATDLLPTRIVEARDSDNIHICLPSEAQGNTYITTQLDC